MFTRIKTALFRRYYLFTNKQQWRNQYDDKPYSTLQIPAGDGGTIAARMYSDTSSNDRPLIVYIHGGGWVIGDLQTHHPFCQLLAQRSNCTVLALDYRLAPEHPFPAANDDCLAACQWVASHLHELGPNNGAMLIAGDSAGGNLTASTCIELDAASREKLCGAVTIYPAVDHYSVAQVSHTERAKAQPLTMNMMSWFWDTWLAGADPQTAMRARPLQSDQLASLPPVFNVTAEYDPLRDEGRAFAAALEAAGVPVEQHHFPKAGHGFACSNGPSENYESFMAELLRWLQKR